MKRSPELTPLSHDHHQALYVAMLLKRAATDDLDAPLKAFLDFAEATGEPHFRIEEEILLPGWLAATAGDRTMAAAMAARVAAEHLEIRTETRLLRSGGGTIERLHALGALLESHVRFEERELFPLVEDSLDAEAIRELGAEIAAAEG